MNEHPSDIVELREDLSGSDLYSDDLAPVPPAKRTWKMQDLAVLWVGMAVCIPTYLLASYMIKAGLLWWEALLIIGLANLIITVPMVLNGHAGVKYGVPFPVIGRAAFGVKGIHLAAVVRGFVACGWFGVQTWIGGLAIYAIFNALSGAEAELGLSAGKFAGFAIFWCINLYFIWQGTESIKWLERYSAPILVLMGVLLIGWGAWQAGGFGTVLEQSGQLQHPAAALEQGGNGPMLRFYPLSGKDGRPKATHYQLTAGGKPQGWLPLPASPVPLPEAAAGQALQVQLRRGEEGPDARYSSVSDVAAPAAERPWGERLWDYVVWLTAMVGFWATMSLSIADITRYAASQRAQVAGQFIGLPGTMMLYSFVGIFVTCAAAINFDDVLVAGDAPWDPVSLLARFDSPAVVVVSQLFMLVATLSTNIAANVIAPANAFSNLYPKKISFRMGGLLTGLAGIALCPWLLLDEISAILIFVSGLLGPVLGIMLSDYYWLRGKEVRLAELYKPDGAYRYAGGYHLAALWALAAGVAVALAGYFIPALEALYRLSWFSGFAVSFVLYRVLAGRK
jgi:cytosine/uracil/thiamine/allantoin permease